MQDNHGPAITPELVQAHNMTLAEYDRICRMLGREPNFVELGLFSALWSEHCSYKSSRIHLGRLPTTASWVIQGPGENAGVIDIGEGMAAVFKIESHNHPSFVEPFQGAATGVGGILRDVFAMGARPMALLDALRFGPLQDGKTRLIMRGVVGGIAHYGNCVGVPTVGGDIYFEPCYSTNPLVNVFCLGIARKERLYFSRPGGSGRPLLYVGSETGRDGIHGANILASRSFDREAEQKRPTVQIGDPFREKILLEATLELLKKGLVEALQDMGAAGLTSSSAEMAGKAGLGLILHLDRVPLREPGMSPYEIMLSESQERMLIILKEGAEAEARTVLDKWEIPYCIVGHLTDDGRMQLLWKGERVGDVPVRALTVNAPVYDRERRPANPILRDRVPWREPEDLQRIVRRWVVSQDFASRRWVYRQYDHTVRANTMRAPGHDAALLRVKGARKALAITVDGNARFCYLEPRIGAQMAVAEAARNVLMLGARPMAITNCLNFGSPENPAVMHSFEQVVEGIREACLALQTPVVSGNVSFYNETEEQAIYPTPVIGMVGLLDDSNREIPLSYFTQPGDFVYLVGHVVPTLTGSTLGRQKGAWEFGTPGFSLEFEGKFQAAIFDVLQRASVHTAHDVSDGGVLWALVEAWLAAPDGCGVDAHFGDPPSRLDEYFCSEVASACILALSPTDAQLFEKGMEHHDISYIRLGEITSSDRMVVTSRGVKVLDLKGWGLRRRWYEAMERLLDLRQTSKVGESMGSTQKDSGA